MPANALVLLAEGAEEMETVIVVDVLRHKFFLKIIQDFQLFAQERWCRGGAGRACRLCSCCLLSPGLISSQVDQRHKVVGLPALPSGEHQPRPGAVRGPGEELGRGGLARGWAGGCGARCQS